MKKKLLLMGRYESGVTSMRSIMFAHYIVRDTRTQQELGATATEDIDNMLISKLSFFGLELEILSPPEEREAFTSHKDVVYRNMEVFIYVFDVESREVERDMHYYQSCLESILQNSPDAKVFCLIHKMDLIPKDQRSVIYGKRTTELMHRSLPLDCTCFPTSIWDETLYSAWSSIISSLVPSRSKVDLTLSHLANVLEADEIVLFEEKTFLVIAHCVRRPHADVHRFEKISNILKCFKLSCSKLRSGFEDLEIRNSEFALFIGAYTVGIRFMVVTSNSKISAASVYACVHNVSSKGLEEGGHSVSEGTEYHDNVRTKFHGHGKNQAFDGKPLLKDWVVLEDGRTPEKFGKHEINELKPDPPVEYDREKDKSPLDHLAKNTVLTTSQEPYNAQKASENLTDELLSQPKKAVQEARQKMLASEKLLAEVVQESEQQQADLRRQLTEATKLGHLREAEAQTRMKEMVEDFQQTQTDLERRAELAEQRAHNSETQWVLDRNEIELTTRELGGGGWGVVKLAKFRGTSVAAKMLYQQIQSDYYRGLFIREMNMAARLRHPNLAQFIGATLEGDMIILTELLHTSLRNVLEQGGISCEQNVAICLDVCKALNYLHLMKPEPIVHRDVSSGNVLLDPLPNNLWKAKLADYGTVNTLQSLKTEGPGNPTYSAPEANLPAQQSPKMDVYSFGILLIEMCSGQFPDVDARERLILTIRDRRFVRLLRKCIVYSKDKRPSMVEVVSELSRF